MSTLTRICASLALAALFYGCDTSTQDAEKTTNNAVPEQLNEVQEKQLSITTRVAWYAAESAINKTSASARQLLTAVEELLQAPSDETLGSAQQQWLVTAEAFQPMHVYELVAYQEPARLNYLRETFFSIAAEPIQPGYLDSFGDYAYSGLVHDVGLTITPETLRQQHGLTNEEDAALGLYAMEFMLFGDRYNAPRRAGDFQAQKELDAEHRRQGFSSPAELPENRRRQLLLTQAQLLVEDLQRLQELWQPHLEESLYNAYVAYPPLERRQLLLRGAQLALTEILVHLTAGATAATSEDGSNENTEVEETPASTDEIPVSFLVSRLQSINELAKILQTDAELQKGLDLAARTLDSATTTAEDDEVIEALRRCINLLATEQQRFATLASG